MADALDTRIATIRVLLGSDSSQFTDAELTAFLEFADKAIIDHLYSMIGIPEEATVPSQYETVSVQAVIAGINLQGGENELVHSENGVSRTFKYSDMLDYIVSHVPPYVKIV